jgi:hypothetical protein
MMRQDLVSLAIVTGRGREIHSERNSYAKLSANHVLSVAGSISAT